MPAITQRDRNRLAALIAIVRPASSLAARLDALSPDDRAEYERWQARYEQWFQRCRARPSDEVEIDARPYARMLDGYGPPTLRRDIVTALFGERSRILTAMTDDQTANIYRIYCDELLHQAR